MLLVRWVGYFPLGRRKFDWVKFEKALGNGSDKCSLAGGGGGSLGLLYKGIFENFQIGVSDSSLNISTIRCALYVARRWDCL